jgi:Lon-like protease
MRRRSLAIAAVLVALAAAALAGVGSVVAGVVPCGLFAAQPRCEVALLPGPTEDTLGLVAIEGATTFPAAGELLLTTIAVREDLDLTTWWQARRSSEIQTVDRETIFPADSDTAEVTEQNRLLMEDSQMMAAVAALETVGYDVSDVATGARVAGVLPDAVTDRLREGEVITAVDGTPVTDAAAVVAAVGDRAPGDAVRFTVRTDDGAPREETVTLGGAPEEPDRGFIGVLLATELELPVEVTIDAGAIGGPSAGFMFALGVVELLGEEDLTGGAVVAGTGTITADGVIGPVGGVPQKVASVGAREGGAPPATVFLVPRENLADATSVTVASELMLVPVDDLAQALDALTEIRAGELPDGAVRRAPGRR